MMELRKNICLGELELINFINLTDEEKEIVRKWRNRENVRKWMYTDRIISQEEHSKFIETLKKDKKNCYWFLKDKKKGDYVGVIYLNKVDFKNKNAYLGIYSNPEKKIKGAGTLLLGMLKNIAFKIAKLHTLKLEVIENNEQAIKFYKKLGFVNEGRLKEYVFKDGEWHDVIVMGIINKEKA